MNILFWNTHDNQNISACLGGLILERRCDIVVLAEYAGEIERLCERVSEETGADYVPLPSTGICGKITGIIKSCFDVDIIRERSRYQIVRVRNSVCGLVLAMIHNDSKLYSDVRRQELTLISFSREIYIIEDDIDTRNTLVLGDFNMEPFQEGFAAVNAMNSVPFKDELENPERIIGGQAYRKFYNPMWKFMSARTKPYATYYYKGASPVEYYWHMFDQVLLRPQLLKAFDDESLSIVTKTERYELMKNGKPDKENFSDHLPIFFTLREDEIK